MYPYPQPYARVGAPLSLDDAAAMQIVAIWKRAFPDAAPLPGIGLPSQNQGVLTMTHTLDPSLAKASPMTINGLPSRSPLANNALYSVEISDGHLLHLYETMLPDIPGQNGAPSSGQKYANHLAMNGVSVAGNHYHWSGGLMMKHFAVAIHSQAIGMDASTFAKAHIEATRLATGALAPPALRQATGG